MSTVDGEATSAPGAVTVDPSDLRQLLVRLFGTVGTPAGNAGAVVDHLVEASLMGVHTHGVMRVPSYLASIEEGHVDPAARPVVAEDHGARVLLDGNGSFGQVAAGAACTEAIARSGGRLGGTGVDLAGIDRAGVAGTGVDVAGGTRGGGSAPGAVVVSVRSAGHLGRIGAYTEALAASGVVGLAFSSVPARQHNVAWAGTRVGRLGTNPISFAFPTSGDPVVSDMSTSATAEGRIRLAWNEGRDVPGGLIRDGRGRPTTDPERFYADPPGTLDPLGGPAYGYKGSALGLLVEVMATLLTGESVDDPTRENNLTLVAIAPPPGFPALADRLAAHIRSADPTEPGEAVLLPGDRERQARAAARGVVVDATTWCALVAHAERLGLPVPPTEPVIA